ncbi:MAG TPA: type II toxin-antitoxin system VapC family toxin [Blastocatellia bacterium]|nr:type II toxin-antitoxin system VapC family toxin [Blastocatellia bacterium]
MKLLLDTHIFLWYISGDARLPDRMREAVRDSQNDVYLSAASLRETIVKYQIGKLPLPQSPETFIPFQRAKHRITSLSLDEDSVARLAALPSIHRAPFDRMLICQALEHNLTMMTVDQTMASYPVSVFK